MILVCCKIWVCVCIIIMIIIIFFVKLPLYIEYIVFLLFFLYGACKQWPEKTGVWCIMGSCCQNAEEPRNVYYGKYWYLERERGESEMYSILSRYKYQCCNISRDSSQANKAKQRPSTSVTHFLPINMQTHFQHSKGQIITSFSFAFPIILGEWIFKSSSSIPFFHFSSRFDFFPFYFKGT